MGWVPFESVSSSAATFHDNVNQIVHSGWLDSNNKTLIKCIYNWDVTDLITVISLFLPLPDSDANPISLLSVCMICYSGIRIRLAGDPVPKNCSFAAPSSHYGNRIANVCGQFHVPVVVSLLDFNLSGKSSMFLGISSPCPLELLKRMSGFFTSKWSTGLRC